MFLPNEKQIKTRTTLLEKIKIRNDNENENENENKTNRSICPERRHGRNNPVVGRVWYGTFCLSKYVVSDN
jgi:hypothetical protein